MPYRFHMLGIPHTITTPEYSTCAFTQKLLKMGKMLKARGHTVIHYGHEDSVVECDENVVVTTNADLETSYPGHDWRTQGWPQFTLEDHVYRSFHDKTIVQLAERKQPGDFLLCMGVRHKQIADAHSDMIAVEPGIGYPNGGYARFRVFESYAALHGYRGMSNIEFASDDWWYDAVIPNYFDLDDFEFSARKDDYFLFLGRVGVAKGINVALQIAQALGSRIIVAGAGALTGDECPPDPPLSEFATFLGPVGPAERRKLLANAKALVAPSQFLEPFCGVQIEAMLSGTPVISTDWGAFAEYNIHGVTGYRCRNFEQFLWAAKNIDTIDPVACRTWAERNFSLERVGELYDEYFASIAAIFDGRGWYEPNPDRTNLNWLYRYPPERSVD